MQSGDYLGGKPGAGTGCKGQPWVSSCPFLAPASQCWHSAPHVTEFFLTMTAAGTQLDLCSGQYVFPTYWGAPSCAGVCPENVSLFHLLLFLFPLLGRRSWLCSLSWLWVLLICCRRGAVGKTKQPDPHLPVPQFLPPVPTATSPHILLRVPRALTLAMVPPRSSWSPPQPPLTWGQQPLPCTAPAQPQRSHG